MGGESASGPNREIVFRVCVCVACVRACVLDLREGCDIELSRVMGLGLRRRLILEENNGLGPVMWAAKRAAKRAPKTAFWSGSDDVATM